MEAFILALVVAAKVWHHSIQRGKRFVRAFAFLDHLDMGDDVATANACANSMVFTRDSNPDADRMLILRAKAFADQYSRGKQIPVISLARSRGFDG
jgi:hypothetical protein